MLCYYMHMTRADVLAMTHAERIDAIGWLASHKKRERDAMESAQGGRNVRR